MKKIAILIFVFGIFVAKGQDKKFTKQYQGTVNYQKVEIPATVFEFPYPASQIEEGLIGFFKEQGSKAKESKGFYHATSVKVPAAGGGLKDVHYKIEKDGKNACKVYAIITEPGEDPIQRNSSQAAMIAGAGAGLSAAMIASMDDHDFNTMVAKQEEEVKKAQKKLDYLSDDAKQLDKRRADLEKDIEKNKQDQISAQSELEAKQKALDALRAKGGKKN